MCGLLVVVASIVLDHRLEGTRASTVGIHGLSIADAILERTGSGIVVHRLGCSGACGIILYQGLNPCILHWQVESLPLTYQGRLIKGFFKEL